ncbi:hypothetical protein [Streptomyces sp. NPDC127038]|uniref:hypothetical protein n=1 Tax=Streptomyces sp. NPDC127038 TaxID=3347114 RepID=UPI003669AAD1
MLFAHVAPDGVKALIVSDYVRGDSELLDGMVERVLTEDLPRCRHLRRRPGRGYLFATEGYARCLACHLERTATGIPAGVTAQCGCCPGDLMAGARPVVVEMASWVVVSAVCLGCARRVLDEGQRATSLEPSASGGGE